MHSLGHNIPIKRKYVRTITRNTVCPEDTGAIIPVKKTPPYPCFGGLFVTIHGKKYFFP